MKGRAIPVTTYAALLLTIEVIVAFPLALFVTVTVCAGVVAPTACEPNASEVGFTDRTPPTTTPVPDRTTVWGVLFAVLLIVSVPENAVAEDGVKVTPNVTLCDGLSVKGRAMPVTTKAALLLTIEVIEVAALPLFVRVTVCGWVVAPTA